MKWIDVDNLKSPLAKARDEYLASVRGIECCDPATLGAGENQRQYLSNRIEAAFIAGWDAKPCCLAGTKRRARSV